jgi:hypothetical protein
VRFPDATRHGATRPRAFETPRAVRLPHPPRPPAADPFDFWFAFLVWNAVTLVMVLDKVGALGYDAKACAYVRPHQALARARTRARERELERASALTAPAGP